MAWMHLGVGFTRRKLEKTAVRVAERSLKAVWQSVQARLDHLSANEARGYIRARSIVLVNNEISAVVDARRISDARRRHILECALDQVVRDVLKQRTRVRTEDRRLAA